MLKVNEFTLFSFCPPGLLTRVKDKLHMFWQNVTIEPALFLIETAKKVDDVVVKNMLLYKICRNDFDESQEVCTDLLNDNNTEVNDLVQNEVR